MKRGEIWTVSGGADYAGKPRPAVVLQENSFSATSSVTICVFTSDQTEAPLFRLLVDPDANNGLTMQSRLMVDKITTVPRHKMGAHIGVLSSDDLLRLNQALALFLGLASRQ